MASRIIACLALSAGRMNLAIYSSWTLHMNMTTASEHLAQYENTMGGAKPDWIPEDVLAETST